MPLAKILCALIYWCEGAKVKTGIAFTNSDPNLVRTFLHLLKTGFDIDEKNSRYVYIFINITTKKAT